MSTLRYFCLCYLGILIQIVFKTFYCLAHSVYKLAILAKLIVVATVVLIMHVCWFAYTASIQFCSFSSL